MEINENHIQIENGVDIGNINSFLFTFSADGKRGEKFRWKWKLYDLFVVVWFESVSLKKMYLFTNSTAWIETRYSRKILSVDYWPHESNVGNCTPPAILEFPSDGLTREQRIHGWIILHILVVFYGFWFLAAICDDYMVPSIEQICSSKSICYWDWNINEKES